MRKNAKKILNQVEKIITKYQNDTSVYYQELTKSYQEYKQVDLLDQTTNDLYLDHMEYLCKLIIEKKYAKRNTFSTILLFILIIFFTFFASYRYYEVANKLNSNILKANDNTSIIVTYKNLESFNALVLGDSDSLSEIRPLTFSVFAKNQSGIIKHVHYDIYLVEQNDTISENELLDRDAFDYQIQVGKQNNGIKSLKDCIIDNNRILIYSGEINTNFEQEVSLKMWINKDSNIEYLNKRYKFKLFVSGYTI